MIREPLSEENLTKIFKTDSKNPDRLIKREDKNHEFKESYNNNNMALYLKTMAAYANNDGGYIIFGVKDSPRILVGMSDKSIQQFNELPVEKVTELLNEYFAPSIEWENCIYQYKGKKYGIIYVHELLNKPVVCKKARDNNNAKYALKEADIYYRYSGRSERIKYAELAKIIEDKRKNEEKQWLSFLMKAAKIGVENASILDLNKGEIQEGGGKILLDENLLEKMRFVKQGHFVDKFGAPTLRWVGDFQTLESGRVVYAGTKKVIKAIEQTDIIEDFLNDVIVDNPKDYIKRICSSTTGKLPVYYYIHLADLSKEETMKIISQTTARGQAKKTLLTKIKDFSPILCKKHPEKETQNSLVRKQYAQQWEKQAVLEKLTSSELKLYLSALLYVPQETVFENSAYIKTKLLALYKEFYESSDSTVAGMFRDVICYLDSALYFNPNNIGGISNA